MMWLINKSTYTHSLQGEIKPFYCLHFIMWRFLSGLEKSFCFVFCSLLFSLDDVGNKVKYVPEASDVCYLHFFHKSWLGRKMLLRKHQEVKCQMQLKDTQREGFYVGWIMNVEHELWIKSFLYLIMGIISQMWVLLLPHRGSLSNDGDPFPATALQAPEDSQGHWWLSVSSAWQLDSSKSKTALGFVSEKQKDRLH